MRQLSPHWAVYPDAWAACPKGEGRRQQSMCSLNMYHYAIKASAAARP